MLLCSIYRLKHPAIFVVYSSVCPIVLGEAHIAIVCASVIKVHIYIHTFVMMLQLCSYTASTLSCIT